MDVFKKGVWENEGGSKNAWEGGGDKAESQEETTMKKFTRVSAVGFLPTLIELLP